MEPFVQLKTLDQLIDIEKTLWSNNAEIYHDTYLPVAILVFPGVGLIDRNTAVAAIRKENTEGRAWAEVHFDDVITKWITVGSVALLAYVATARWNYEETAFQTYCTTIYVRKDESWKVALHQQTRV